MYKDGRFEVELEYKTKDGGGPWGGYMPLCGYDMEWAAGIVTFFLMNPAVDTLVIHSDEDNTDSKLRRVKKEKCCK